MMAEALDLGLIRGIITAVLLGAFIGMVFWAYSTRRHGEFEEASLLPLEDESEDNWSEQLEMPRADWEMEGNKR